jgi:hypothetical protein
VHFAVLASSAAVKTVALSGIAAILATNGLVCKSLFGKEFLVAGSENKFFTAVFACQDLILVHLLSPRFYFLLSTEPWPNRMPDYHRLDIITPAVKYHNILGESFLANLIAIFSCRGNSIGLSRNSIQGIIPVFRQTAFSRLNQERGIMAPGWAAASQAYGNCSCCAAA